MATKKSADGYEGGVLAIEAMIFWDRILEVSDGLMSWTRIYSM